MADRRQKSNGVALGSPPASGAGGAVRPEYGGRDRRLIAGAAASFLIPLLLYGGTCCRDIYWGDSSEFALVAHETGIGHPTGYPLYCMIIALLARIPLFSGNPALSTNLFSALAGAGACLLVYGIALRTYQRPLASCFSALIFGISLEVWSQSTVAEVYTLHILLVAAVWFAAAGLIRRPSRLRLNLIFLCIGFALSNHLTSVLLIPPVLILVWQVIRLERREERSSVISRKPDTDSLRHSLKPARTVWMLLIGLSLYGYLPLRSLADPFLDHGDPETLERFRWLVSGSQFHYLMFKSGESNFFDQLRAFLPTIVKQFTLWPLILLLPAMIRFRRYTFERRLGIIMAIYAIMVTVYSLNYSIEDKSAYFLPLYLVLALWIGGGALWLEEAVSGSLESGARVRRVVLWIVLFCCCILPLQRNYHVADRRSDQSLRQYTDAVMATVPAGSLVILDDPFVYSAYLYGNRVEGRYDGIECILDYLFPFPWYLEHLLATRPDLRLPAEAFEVAREDWIRQKRERGRGFGVDRDRALFRIKREIIEANLEKRTVCLHVRDDTEMKTVWGGTHPLVYLGLCYQITAVSAMEIDYSTGFPFFDRTPTDRTRPPHLYQMAAYHKFSDAANRKGVILVSQDKPHEALEQFERALIYDPDNYVVLKNRGMLHLDRFRDVAAARRDFIVYLTETGLAGDSKDPDRDAIRNFLERTAR